MALSREQLRKLHEIPEPTSPADPAVLSRRTVHEAAAKWLAKWSPRLQTIFALTGFIVVLLPTLAKPWRAIIDGTPIVARIFHDFSTLSGLAMVNFFTLMILFIARSLLTKYTPAGYSPILSYQDVVDMELYPRAIKEELAYWTDIASGVAGTTLWLFLPFAVLAYFIRLGG